MKIKTYPEATQELRKIAAFCKQQWGIEIAHRLIETYQRNKKRLSSNPYMAPIEPLIFPQQELYVII